MKISKSKDGCLCVLIPEQVKVRKHECDIEELKRFLKTHKRASGITNKKIAETLEKPLTLVEHWFRLDTYFAVPDADTWFELKEMLNIKNCTYDLYITDFEIRDGLFETSDRVYLETGKGATLTTSPYRIGVFKNE
jgi:hypothetical protein